MRLVRGLGGVVVASALVASATGALAVGVVAPKDAGALLVPSLDALVVSTATDELLVLQPGYELKGGKAPASLGLIVPLPAVPAAEQCATVDDGIFRAVATLRGAGEVHEGQGTLEVAPLDGKGPAAIKSLEGWLEKNTFAGFRDNDLRFYAGAGFGFVAAKVGGKLPAKGFLHPFALRFATNRPYLPLKLLSQTGPLELRATFLTTKAIDPRSGSKQGWKDAKAPGKAGEIPKEIADLLATKLGAGLGDELKKGDVHLFVVSAKQNGEDKAGQIDAWRQDPTINLEK